VYAQPSGRGNYRGTRGAHFRNGGHCLFLLVSMSPAEEVSDRISFVFQDSRPIIIRHDRFLRLQDDITRRAPHDLGWLPSRCRDIVSLSKTGE
jgi:hypothetical protein